MATGRKGSALSRQRRQQYFRKKLMVYGGIAAAALILVLAIVLIPKGAQDKTVPAVSQVDAAPTQAPDTAALTQEAALADTPEPTPVPEPTPTAYVSVNSARAATRPTPTAPGFMPVFTKAKTDEKIIAITVDDCFQASNLRQIVDKAIEVGGKLTIFPIGENVLKSQQSEILKYAWENGFELENHTFTHNGLFNVTPEKLAEEVYKQQLALSYILGVEYHCHFLRPRGGDARGDQRMQMFAQQMGYYGIAHWSVSGSSDDAKIAKGLKPGAIFLFHTTNKDLDKLLRFIPWAVEQGYQLVTLNEMFDYPDNETSPLTVPINEHVIPELQPYETAYPTLKKTSYSWMAWRLQEKLIELGYLKGSPDGVYGSDCESAIRAYQRDNGLEQTGVADEALQRRILES